MPKFNKTAEELDTKFDKWLYVLKNLHRLDRIPEKLKENIFLKLFETAEIAKFNQQEYHEYEDSLKYYRDIINSLDTAREEGERKKQIEIARGMKKDGLSTELISKYTGLSSDDINEMKID